VSVRYQKTYPPLHNYISHTQQRDYQAYPRSGR